MKINRLSLWPAFFLMISLCFLASCDETRSAPVTGASQATTTRTRLGVTPQPTVTITALSTLTPQQTASIPAPSSPTPTAEPPTCLEGLPPELCKTLQSLKKVDDYPLYTMFYYGEYRRVEEVEIATGRSTGETSRPEVPAWGCSLFAAYAAGANGLFGRNFDWQYSPAVLLFTNPPTGYASVSMVDIAYLVPESEVNDLDSQPLEARLPLLDAPFWPFDGMNEHGLAVGMAAVPAGQGAPNPGKETIDSLMVMRLMLDGARDVDEALEIFTSYNIEMGGGPPLHYLVADASGQSVLIEFYQGELVVLPGEASWQQMTNFLRASAGDSAEGQCWRYDLIDQRLRETKGSLSIMEAMDLLEGVAQDNTQWSILYGMNTGEILVSTSRQYDTVHHFLLDDYQTTTP